EEGTRADAPTPRRPRRGRLREPCPGPGAGPGDPTEGRSSPRSTSRRSALARSAGHGSPRPWTSPRAGQGVTAGHRPTRDGAPVGARSRSGRPRCVLPPAPREGRPRDPRPTGEGARRSWAGPRSMTLAGFAGTGQTPLQEPPFLRVRGELLRAVSTTGLENVRRQTSARLGPRCRT